MSTIKNVIFDLGGVLYDINYKNTIEAFRDLGILDPEQLYSQKNQTQLFDEFETGKMDEKTFLQQLKKEFPGKVSEEELLKAWNAMLMGMPEHRIDFLLEIAEDYNVYLLSNTNSIHMRQIEDELIKSDLDDLKSYFDEAFLSFEIGKRKPDVSTFEWVINELGIDPEETIFIDDSAQHVNGAKQAGLHVYHHTDGDIVEVFDEVIEWI
jgi:HAD superfamily hydrolase (TIGR01509 family)